MAGFLGTIAGRIRIDVKSAVASYAAVRAANASTLYALRGTSTAFIATGKALGIGGALMVAAFAKAVSAAAEFERKLDFFGAVTNATGEELAKVSEKALQLGQDTIYSADQIAASFVELGKAGISADLIISGVGDAVAHLGASADIPLVQAADIITAAVQTFNLKGREAVHVADLLQGAANASIVEVEDLGVSLKYVGGIAASISIPIESTIDALSLLGKAGIRGSTAGTSLRQIMVSLTGTSKKASGVLKDLGIITKDGANAFFDAQGKAKPLGEIFQILQDKTKNLTEAQRLAAFKVIFNNRALAAANILTRSGAKGFAAMNKEIGKTTAADVSAKRLDNLSGDIEILRGNIETLLIKGGAPFQEFLRQVVQGITKFIQKFSELSPETQKNIFAFLGIAGATLVVMGAISTVIGVVANFIGTIKRLFFAFRLIGTIVRIVIVAMRLLSIAFLTNPIGLIITAVALLVAGFILLYQNSEDFRNIIGNIGKFFVSVWESVLAFFQGVPQFFSDLWQTIQDAFSTGLQWIKDNWQTLLLIISGPVGWVILLIQKFKDRIIEFFSTMWENVKSAVANGISATISFFRELPNKILYWIGFLFGRLVRIWFEIQKFLWTNAAAIVLGVINFFKELPARIVAFFVSLAKNVVAKWNAFKTAVTNIAIKVVANVIDFFKKLPGRIVAFFVNLKNGAVQKFTEFWNRTKAIAIQLIANVVKFFSELPGKIAKFFLDLKTRAVAKLVEFWIRAKAWAENIKNGFIKIVQGLPGLVAKVFQDILSNIGSFVSDLWSKAKEAGSSLWEGFKDGLGINSPSYLEKAVFQINKTFGIEVPKMKKQVQKIQTFTDDVVTNNPAARASNAAGVALSRLSSQASKIAAIQSAIRARDIGLRAARTTIPSSVNSGATTIINKTINNEINSYNPVAEPTSITVTKELTRLAALGIGS